MKLNKASEQDAAPLLAALEVTRIIYVPVE